MSLGGDKFIHAPHTGDVVKVSSLDEAYYKAQFTGGRRFDSATAAAPAPVPVAAPAAAPAIDPAAVAQAQARVAADAAEVNRPGSGLFKAITAQEAKKAGLDARRLAGLEDGDAGTGGARAPEDGEPPAGSRDRPADGAEGFDGNRIGDGEDPAKDSGIFAALDAKPREPDAAPPPANAAGVTPAVPPPAPAPPADPAAAQPAAPAPDPAAVDPGPAPDLADVANDYPGDNAGQQALARWLAKQAEDAGLPPELPVMASLVESGVRNLDFGDADSVGFFQMRLSIWNRGEYAGYPRRPELQAKWFIDQALAVKRQRVARGQSITDPSQFGEWIADIERPAEQFRGRYQLRLAEARRLLR
jgi:hypothetical protein